MDKIPKEIRLAIYKKALEAWDDYHKVFNPLGGPPIGLCYAIRAGEVRYNVIRPELYPLFTITNYPEIMAKCPRKIRNMDFLSHRFWWKSNQRKKRRDILVNAINTLSQ